MNKYIAVAPKVFEVFENESQLRNFLQNICDAGIERSLALLKSGDKVAINFYIGGFNIVDLENSQNFKR